MRRWPKDYKIPASVDGMSNMSVIVVTHTYAYIHIYTYMRRWLKDSKVPASVDGMSNMSLSVASGGMQDDDDDDMDDTPKGEILA